MLGHLGLSDVHAEDSDAVTPRWLCFRSRLVHQNQFPLAELNYVKKEQIFFCGILPLTIFISLWSLRGRFEEPQRSVYVSSFRITFIHHLKVSVLYMNILGVKQKELFSHFIPHVF